MFTVTEFLKRLGAPRKNTQWSWGSIRDDGAVFLPIYQDRIQKIDGSTYARITFHKVFENAQSNLGFRERLRQIEMIRQGAQCYVIAVVPQDPYTRPRKIKSFNDEFVWAGGKIVEIDGESWIEMGEKIKARDLFRVAVS